MEKITYGIHKTPIGEVIIAQSARGLCWLGFMVTGYKGNGQEKMLRHFPDVEFIQGQAATAQMVQQILSAWRNDKMDDIKLDLRGTEFQQKVWRALCNIPKGKTFSYGQIANDIGAPKAARAVGSAVGSNPVSLIVPCHRVLHGSGGIGNYGWGVELKAKLLREEGVL